LSDGRSSAARIAMMAMTIRSSMRVKAERIAIRGQRSEVSGEREAERPEG